MEAESGQGCEGGPLTGRGFCLRKRNVWEPDMTPTHTVDAPNTMTYDAEMVKMEDLCCECFTIKTACWPWPSPVRLPGSRLAPGPDVPQEQGPPCSPIPKWPRDQTHERGW